MRMMLNVLFPPEPFNAAVRKGTIGETINRILRTKGITLDGVSSGSGCGVKGEGTWYDF